jgi:hypothetical protein
MDLVELKNKLQETTTRHPWELARLKVITSLIDKHIAIDLHHSMLVFDIGCGDTFVAESLNERYPGFEFAAIDIEFTDEMISFYQGRYDQSKRNIHLFKTVEAAESHYDRKASMVLLLDVAEHIQDDNLFFKNLNSGNYTDDKTVFIITVPAFQALFCSHDVFLKHYRRYTLSTLTSVLNRNGFDIVNKNYFFSSLCIPRVMQVMREKMFKPKLTQGIGNWNGNEMLGKLIYFSLLIDYFISSHLQKLKIILPGLSIYAICKKHV